MSLRGVGGRFSSLISSITTSGSSISSFYADVRPHHLVVLYAAYYCCFSITGWSASKIAKSFLRFVNNKLAGVDDSVVLPWIHAGLVPDCLIRWGIRLRLRNHLDLLAAESVEQELEHKMQIVQELSEMPIAVETDAANAQHYEVPTAFYDLCLGPAKKYSAGLWLSDTTTFPESEERMLELYCQRAGVVNGMRIVDLGCGWGSLTLYIAKHYPDCVITAISNSNSQREYIYKAAELRCLNSDNIHVITCNVADDKGALKDVKNNDLVMTVEMFEHMKNYQELLDKVHGFLKPKTGKLFVHIFTHKDYAYHFDSGWMSDNFFTGGTMPSDDLLLYFTGQSNFGVLNHWRVNGTHYEKTSNGWLQYLDANWKNGTLKPVLADAYGVGNEREWYVNWRLFFLACAELWGLDGGEEWIVSHYLFQRQS